jgi:hypothetical protein
MLTWIGFEVEFFKLVQSTALDFEALSFEGPRALSRKR